MNQITTTTTRAAIRHISRRHISSSARRHVIMGNKFSGGVGSPSPSQHLFVIDTTAGHQQQRACYHSTQRRHKAESTHDNKSKILIGVGAALGAYILFEALKKRDRLNTNKETSYVNADVLHAEEQIEWNASLGQNEYTKAEVAKHKTKESRIWVTYKDGVYDITDFVAQHPGGEKILLAAGAAIDPFWKLYAIHNTEDILNMLEEFRIGTLKKGEYIPPSENKSGGASEDDPYKDEPEREAILKINTEKAFNAETPPSILIDQFITPNEVFFVRNHLPVPMVDSKNYELEITGIGVKDVKLTIEDLKTKFIHHSVITTMQCAGNRRSEMSAAKPVKGIEWTSGAIGTAEWTGVRLRDVLQHAGLEPEKCDNNPKIRHVQFEGLDRDLTNTHYGGSIPIEKAIDLHGDVLLAFQMNGVEIPRDHGYPIRVIVPGTVGARNVKWLSKIVVSGEESKSFWQQQDYKGFPPTNKPELLDPKKATSIQELPVQSSICEPQNNTTVEEGETVRVRGYAWSGGGRDVIRVDITNDNGHNWVVADLKKPVEQRPGRAWAWTPFEAEVDLPNNHDGKVRICTKAVDAAYNVQPEHVESVWNPRGFLNNVWSCVNLIVKKDEDDNE